MKTFIDVLLFINLAIILLTLVDNSDCTYIKRIKDKIFKSDNRAIKDTSTTSVSGGSFHDNPFVVRMPDEEWTKIQTEAKEVAAFYQSFQSEYLAAAIKELESNKAVYQADFARWGDYLQIKLFCRGQNPYSKDNVVNKVITSTKLENTIRFVEGKPPSLEAKAQLYYDKIFKCFVIMNRAIIKDDTGSWIVNSDYISMGNNSIEVMTIDGLASSSINDQIVFGDGGEQIYQNSNFPINTVFPHTSTISYPIYPSGPPIYVGSNGSLYVTRQPLTGMTLYVPFGLGQDIYVKILQAIKEGAET